MVTQNLTGVTGVDLVNIAVNNAVRGLLSKAKGGISVKAILKPITKLFDGVFSFFRKIWTAVESVWKFVKRISSPWTWPRPRASKFKDAFRTLWASFVSALSEGADLILESARKIIKLTKKWAMDAIPDDRFARYDTVACMYLYEATFIGLSVASFFVPALKNFIVPQNLEPFEIVQLIGEVQIFRSLAMPLGGMVCGIAAYSACFPWTFMRALETFPKLFLATVKLMLHTLVDIIALTFRSAWADTVVFTKAIVKELIRPFYYALTGRKD
jgi:hypothetical protein